VRRAIDIIKASGAKTVLEVGCGDGWNCGEMSKAGLDVVGTDFIQNAITYASALVPEAKFICGDLTSEEFKSRFPEKFDAVALIEVIEHIPPADCVSAIRNIVTPLKPGGVMVLTTPSENFPNDNIYHYQHFTEQRLRQIMADAGGLTVVSVEGYGDVEAERAHWKRMRLADNRFYSIKPAMRYLNSLYAKIPLTHVPLSRSHGLIVIARS
jgi:SAM-dependent methyltransferase